MKIGILTATRTDNNGTDLQALAMLNMFRRLGAGDVELIDYVCQGLESSRYLLKPLSLRKILYYPIKLCLHYKHVRFRDLYFKKSSTKFDQETLATAQYEKIVVGSDQIWNLIITDNDLSFFLPFERKGLRKYSYAASIGRDDIHSWESKFLLSEKLNDFQTVSVREDSAVKTLSEIGITARHDLDPILMGSVDDWKGFIKRTRNEKYMVIYFMDSHSSAWSKAKELAKIKGWDVININPVLRSYGGVSTLRCVGVDEWLSLIANAEMIFTSSYHCLSFAILFNKSFCLVPEDNSVQNNARMIDLVNRVGLQKCIYNQSYDYSQIIDWGSVNTVVGELRRKSEEYVRLIINN